MKKLNWFIFYLLVSFLLTSSVYSQESTTIVAPTNEAGENLDLYAVMELFEKAESVEEFENAINNPDNEVNNLDLNEDGKVDYIRVVEQAEENTHIFILQAIVGEDTYTDVATINVEKKSEDDWVLQAVGAEEIYGEDYIVEPEQTTVVVVQTYPVVRVVFVPGYRVWLSPWRWRHYPALWKPWKPHPIHIHRSRTARYHKHSKYRHTKVRRSSHANNMYKTQKKSTKGKQQKTKQTKKQQPKKDVKKTQGKKKGGTTKKKH